MIDSFTFYQVLIKIDIMKEGDEVRGYILSKIIQAKGFSQTWRATQEGYPRVLKFVCFSHRDAKQIDKQKQMYSELKDINLVTVFDVFTEKIDGNNYLVTAMEECPDGNFVQLIEDRQRQLSEKLHLMVEVAKGLAYLHKKNIVHRNLKAENLLLVKKSAKVSDLGLAKIIKASNTRMTTQGGNVNLYIAPEMHFQDNYSLEVDVWSLGLILLEISLGDKLKNLSKWEKLPFQSFDILEGLIQKVEPINKNLRFLLKQMLKEQKQARIKSSQVINKLEKIKQQIKQSEIQRQKQQLNKSSAKSNEIPINLEQKIQSMKAYKHLIDNTQKKTKNMASKFEQFGIYLNEMRRYTESISQYNQALKIMQKITGQESQQTAIIYHNMGNSYIGNREYERAISYFHRSMKIRDNINLQIPHQKASTYYSLGSAYLNKGSLKQAEQRFNQGLLVAKQIQSKEDSNKFILSGYSNLGSIKMLQGQYKQAKQILKKGLLIQQSANKDFSTIRFHLNFVLVNLKLREFKDCLQNLEETLKEIHKPNHGRANNDLLEKEYEERLKEVLAEMIIDKKINKQQLQSVLKILRKYYPNEKGWINIILTKLNDI